VDVDSGLTHTVMTTAANESDVAQVADLLHGKETTAHGDAGCTGAHAYVENPKLKWVVAKRRSQAEKIASGCAHCDTRCARRRSERSWSTRSGS
jgi:IS5 family transposase